MLDLAEVDWSGWIMAGGRFLRNSYFELEAMVSRRYFGYVLPRIYYPLLTDSIKYIVVKANKSFSYPIGTVAIT